MSSSLWFFIIATVISLAISKQAKRRGDTEVDEAEEVQSEFDFSETEDFETEVFCTQPENYFTYEKDMVDNDLPTQKATPKVEVAANSLTEDQNVDFDLRKAVIYQTILQNDYIAETK